MKEAPEAQDLCLATTRAYAHVARPQILSPNRRAQARWGRAAGGGSGRLGGLTL